MPARAADLAGLLAPTSKALLAAGLLALLLALRHGARAPRGPGTLTPAGWRNVAVAAWLLWAGLAVGVLDDAARLALGTAEPLPGGPSRLDPWLRSVVLAAEVAVGVCVWRADRSRQDTGPQRAVPGLIGGAAVALTPTGVAYRRAAAVFFWIGLAAAGGGAVARAVLR